MSQSRAMQRLCGLMRKAVQDYEMIAPGDKVMVGVSGGKDSVALTIGLAELRRYIGFDFTVQAVTLDPQFGGRPMDYTVLQDLFARHGIPYEIRRTEIGPVVFEYRQEKNPCSLCARLRRGALHTAAQELGCKNTHFANTTGLTKSGHYSSAWDLYLITREAMTHDDFMTIVNTKSYEIPPTNKTEEERVLHSTNALISNFRVAGYIYEFLTSLCY